MKNIFILCWLLLVLLVSCKTKIPDHVSIQGQLTNGPGEKIVLTELGTKSISRLDSVTLDEGGKFSFLVKLSEPGFYMLQSQQGKVLVLFARPGDTILLNGNLIFFPENVIVKGPGETELLEEFFRYTRQNEKRVDSLENLLVENQESEGYYALTQKIDSAFRQIWIDQLEYEKAFIDRHPSSLISLIVLNYAFGLNTVLSPADDSIYFLKLDSSLMRSCPGNKHTEYHHQRILELRREQEMNKGKKE
ncbi:MAG: DUF4369 domain-containing protein [bacterium]